MNLKGLKNRVVSSKTVAVVGTTGVLVAGMATNALAVGTADTAVTTAFTSQSDNIIATMGAVAPLAIGVFAIFLGWKYGKKIFSKVAG